MTKWTKTRLESKSQHEKKEAKRETPTVCLVLSDFSGHDNLPTSIGGHWHSRRASGQAVLTVCSGTSISAEVERVSVAERRKREREEKGKGEHKNGRVKNDQKGYRRAERWGRIVLEPL